MAQREDSFEKLDGPAPGHEAGRFRRFERATTMHANNFIVRRFKNLKEVRRTALAWIGCAVLLVLAGVWQVSAGRPLYSHVGAVEGGSYVEGMVGQVDTLNPIFVTNAAERSASRLLFASLLTVDDEGDFSGQLAQSWSMADNGREYTVTLKPDLKWSDGVAVTSRDVIFTIQTIQNPAVRSPYASAWREIIVEAADERTVKIKLPGEYAPFLDALTVGILPEHLLEQVPAERLRSTAFNLQPVVSSGPFSFRSLATGRSNLSQQEVNMSRNDSFVGGAPKLERFTLRLYKDGDLLTRALEQREVMAAVNVPHDQLEAFEGDSSLKQTTLRPYSGVFAFFKQSTPPLDDVKVRQALLQAVNRTQLVDNLAGATPMDGPLLPGQLGYDAKQKQAPYDARRAAALLDEAGWKLENGQRRKDGRNLKLNLVSIASGDFMQTSQALQKAWVELGVEIESNLVRQEEFQSTVVSPHSYDVLVYELSLGRDSDTFAYWHSSQAEPGRLNLAEYRSSLADEALSSGRTRNDPALRAVKYQAFASTWLADVPAIALYRPQIAYVSLAKTRSVSDREVGDVVDRLSNVTYWTAETAWLDNSR